MTTTTTHDDRRRITAAQALDGERDEAILHQRLLTETPMPLATNTMPLAAAIINQPTIKPPATKHLSKAQGIEIVKSVAPTWSGATDMLDITEYTKRVNAEVERLGYPPMLEGLVQTYLTELKKKGEMATDKRGRRTVYGKPLVVETPVTEAADELPTTPNMRAMTPSSTASGHTEARSLLPPPPSPEMVAQANRGRHQMWVRRPELRSLPLTPRPDGGQWPVRPPPSERRWPTSAGGDNHIGDDRRSDRMIPPSGQQPPSERRDSDRRGHGSGRTPVSVGHGRRSPTRESSGDRQVKRSADDMRGSINGDLECASTFPCA
eukprot:m.170376 g.170376  ORF g.170376 m.170376 type:complete len:321 (+) comp24203_c0_seq8:531-1493(+)